MKRGRVASARMISTRRRSPPESACPLLPASRSIFSSASSSPMRLLISPALRPSGSSTMRMFSSTVSFLNTEGSWAR